MTSIPSAALCLVAGLIVGSACLVAQGPLPGDVGVTHLLQAGLGDAPRWATWLTRTAKAPLVLATLVVSVGLAFMRGGRRAAVLPVVTIIAVYGLDPLLRAVVFAPKPSADLVAVAAASTSSGVPSTFGLVYGGLFGAVCATPSAGTAMAKLASGLSIVSIVAGAAARIVLGGHWLSQLVASVLLAFALVLALQAALGAVGFGVEAGPAPAESSEPSGRHRE